MRAKSRAGLAGVALLGTVVALVAPWPSERPVTLASLAAGDCFRSPSAHYLRNHPDAEDGSPRLVVVTPCREPHAGEVVAQTTVDRDRPAYGDLVSASSAACHDSFADYSPDSWALPANVGLAFAPPRDQDTGAGPTVTCFYIGQSFMITGGLRADPGRLTPEQRRYLDAVRAYDSTSADSLDTLDSAPAAGLQVWAGEMAGAEQRMVDALQQIGAPPGTEKPFAVLLDQHRKAAAAWQVAASDPNRVHAEIAAARDAEHAALDAAQAVRAALGLATAIRPTGYAL